MTRTKHWTSLLAATLFLSLACAGVAIAGEEHHKVKLAFLAEDGERVEIAAEDLAIGESRQFFTESGKEVVLTRTDEGFDVTIDGEPLDLGSYGAHGAHGAHGAKVFIKKHCKGDDCGKHKRVRKIVIGDGEGDGEEMVHVVRMKRPSALKHLEESGVLGQLSAADRDKIIAALEEFEARDHEVHVDVEAIHGDGENVWIDENHVIHELDDHDN